MPNQGIKIDISAQIVGYQASLKKLKQMAANIDLGSSLGKSVSAAIKSAEKELAVLQKNPIQTAKSQGQIEGVLNKANRVGQAIQNIGTMMQSVTGSSLNLQALGAEFTKLASDIDGLQTKLNQSMDLGIQDAIKNSAELQAAFQALGVSTDKITAKKGGDILANGLEKARGQAQKLTAQYESMRATFQSQQSQMESKYKNNPFVGGTFNTDAFSKQINEILNPKQIVDGSKIQELKQRLIEQLTNLKIPTDQFSKFQDEINRLLVPDIKPDQVASALAQITKLFSQGLGEKGIGSGIQKRIYGSTQQQVLKSIMGIDVNDLETAKQQLQAKLTQIQDGLQPKDIAHIKTLIDTGSIQQAKIATIKAMHDANQQVKDNYKKDLEQIENLRQKIAALQVKKNEAVQKFTTIQTGSQNYNEVIASLQKQLQQTTAEKQRLQQELEARLEQRAGNIKSDASGIASVAAQLNLGADAAARYGTQLQRVQARQQMVGKIQGVVQRWFSIYAAVRIVSNAIREINSTIQQLDTTITEIAIVTDMSHSDLWGQMDDYVDLADKYAASISGVYKVSQLYYQQGLQQTDVMALTQQTLKMARISGLDYQAATNYMTNAVRSFKMQMTDAQQVVDAYSAVAASSATSVSELATAMSKTASSAQAVGSSFQNTTAMMAVMIQATRESAENIGSAMKSIISRYGEMTSDPSAMKDSEGQEMSLNRVDKALKSVGISMQTAQGQFRDFDDVIMELASKWNTLDTNTQRYIATIMA